MLVVASDSCGAHVALRAQADSYAWRTSADEALALVEDLMRSVTRLSG
jgi:hypothetical protein